MCSPAAIESVLDHVARMFMERDGVLLTFRAHERTVTHRVAVYLESHFPDWHVDCEYNRHGVGTDPKEDDEGERVFPDIIVHHRGTPDNLLVIEAKPEWRGEPQLISDRDKLGRIVRAHRYEHAYLMRFWEGERPGLRFERVDPIG